MRLIQVESIGGKIYVFVYVDDYSRFSWVMFIREKSNTFEVFKDLCQLLQREKRVWDDEIRSDHGIDFENYKFFEYYASEGISHEFSVSITPQKMGWWKGRIKLFKNVKETLTNELCKKNCHFERNKVCELVPRHEDVNVIDTKWIYSNRNKVLLLKSISLFMKIN